MDSLESMLDSPPGVGAAATLPVSASPSDRLMDELFESPFPLMAFSLTREADQEEHWSGCVASKKICFDGAAPRVATAVPTEDFPTELVCLILSFLFVDDVGNHNSGAGAVSRTWRHASEWLACAWADDPQAIPMLASPCVFMRGASSRMRSAVEGQWSCSYPCGMALPRRAIARLLSPLGWLDDDTIVLFFCYVLCIPTLGTTVHAAKESLSAFGALDEWVCPQAVLIEPYIIEAFTGAARGDDATNLFHKNPSFGEIISRILMSACTVYVPICIRRSHWILVVVSLRAGVVEVYDSMGGTHNKMARLVIHFLETICRSHVHKSLNDILNIQRWTVIQHGATSPQQDDSAACGVFVCITGICISSDRPVLFSHSDVLHWRLRIAFLLVTNGAADTITDAPTCSRVVRVREDPDGSLEILSDDEERE